MRSRIKYEEGKIVLVDRSGNVEVNSSGQPKSLSEKMLELKKGSLGDLFAPESKASGGGSFTSTEAVINGERVKVASREASQKGAVDIDGIASGKIVIR